MAETTFKEGLLYYKLLINNIYNIYPAKLTNKRGWMCCRVAPGPSSKIDGIMFIMRATLSINIKVNCVAKLIRRTAKFKIVALKDGLHYVWGSNVKIDRAISKWIARHDPNVKSIQLSPTNLVAIEQYLAARM